ncbi:hypothetical protein IEQ34_000005 [Dendrobium chrysotoxum]|uniref:MORF/ORRM1/DAG-like MORF domain-containing protein n=1 Tax=Dendrobium chrysotoxum TaxID=161865 RepID=A0AAV7HRK3_DENCH|nr:hypothetical protein IEQ34_000005 [Dendrobium chrysotoxum]
MALLIRLRRAAALSSSILRDCSFSSTAYHSSHFPLSNPRCPTASPSGNPSFRIPSLIRSSSFHSSSPCSVRRVDPDQGSKIPEDEILFEGCDYNHWLITMDFPKDPKPSPEEMVETYVQTLAKVVGSVEEAKKRMYACSTTTYQGFQAVMTEEMSEKFRGLPGVVFILPDSYIDPVNKEYGGDKYDNGVITPRPPPIQYGRQGRYGDRNRRYDQPRYERQRPPSSMHGRDTPPQNEHQQMYQGNPTANFQGSTQGYGGNYTPRQNYGPPGQDGWRNYGPPGDIQKGYSPMQQGNPQMQEGHPQMQQGYARNYGPPQNFGPPQDGRSYGRPGDTQQGYSPLQHGNPQMQQGSPQIQHGNPQMQQGYPHVQQGSPQMPSGNQQYSRNGLMQDGGTYAPQQNYSPHGDKQRD